VWEGPIGTEAEEQTRGVLPYTLCLQLLHHLLQPNRYLEIGVRDGTSLVLANCESFSVDPFPVIDRPISKNAKLVEATSDAYFEVTPVDPDAPFDLVFIDGMHHSDFALRDFANAERRCRPGAVIVFDDILPSHPKQTLRDRQTGTWTGDVWKIAFVLRKWRPDLRLIELDTHPTGLLLVANLDPASSVLADNLDAIVNEMEQMVDVPGSVLERSSAIRPTRRNIVQALTPAVFRLGWQPLELSVMVVSYDASLGLPRLLRSLSPQFQQGVAREKYEILLMDLGSGSPLDRSGLEAIAPNLFVATLPGPSRSTNEALRMALFLAGSDFLGLIADESVIVSPGLLASAIEFRQEHPKAVIGVHSFELAPKKSPFNLIEGYGPVAERKFLDSLGWEQDGYRLFEFSELVDSSKQGWHSLPLDPKMIFMEAESWEPTPLPFATDLSVWPDLCLNSDIEIGIMIGEGVFSWIAAKNPLQRPNPTPPLIKVGAPLQQGNSYIAPTGSTDKASHLRAYFGNERRINVSGNALHHAIIKLRGILARLAASRRPR
jgi:hypothetical protein